jgi:hypothetical protein
VSSSDTARRRAGTAAETAGPALGSELETSWGCTSDALGSQLAESWEPVFAATLFFILYTTTYLSSMYRLGPY